MTFGLLFVFLMCARADEPVNLAGGPPATTIDMNEAHGRLDIEYLLIPEAKLTAFADAFDTNNTAASLDALLKLTGGKVVASASTTICLGGDGTMLEIAESRLTLRPRISSATEFHLDGRLTRSTFSSTFDILIAPGQYQLFLLWNQPPHGGTKDPYNAVVARMREITVESPNGEVRTLVTNPGPLPEPPVPPVPPPAPDAGIPAPPPPLPPAGKILYENRGDNTKGFAIRYSAPNFTPHGVMLVANDPVSGCRPDAVGWMSLPVALPGDFQIDFDVRADANDAMSWTMLFDDATNKGIFICNRTNTSFGDASLSIVALTDLTQYQQIFNHNGALAGAHSEKFPDQTWTHVRITKTGKMLRDDVGGQVISTTLPDGALSTNSHLGLGYYATKNVGGNGQMQYANIRVIPLL